MSLTARQLSYLISDDPYFLGGAAVLLDETPNLVDSGWDTLVQNVIIRRISLTPEQLASLYPIGGQLGLRTWWVVGAKPYLVAAGVWRIEVTYKGWAATRPPMVKVGANADQQSASNVLAPAYPGDTVGTEYDKVETHENMPTIAVSYFVENIDALIDGGSSPDYPVSNTGLVGTAKTPPVTIDVPVSVWAFLTEFVYHWPNGWVLMASDQDRLPGTLATLVTDSYKYIRATTPG